MGEKITLNVDVPAIGQRLNFVAPKLMTIGNMLALMIELIAEEYKGIHIKGSSAVLLDTDKKAVLPREATVAEISLINGSNLLLI